MIYIIHYTHNTLTIELLHHIAPHPLISMHRIRLSVSASLTTAAKLELSGVDLHIANDNSSNTFGQA